MELAPYFMENELWYVYDLEHHKYVLTDLAPEEAKSSYEEYLENREHKGKHFFT